MKQGTGHNTQSTQKREPISHAVSVDAVADIGIHHIDLRPEPLFEGRGYKAPSIDSTIHHCGSQGKHR